jgi:hypothetical protein
VPKLSVHGFERTAELLDAIRAPVFSPFVAVRDGRITRLRDDPHLLPRRLRRGRERRRLVRLDCWRAHTVEQPASFILPTRQAGVFRWCLSQGMRPVKPMTYMTIGEYREPNSAWIPSVL